MEKEFLKAIYDYQKIIYKVCKVYRDSKEDQEDLFQEIVYQLWKSYASFKGESKLSSWMYKIALNTAMAVYRKGKLAVTYFDDMPEAFQYNFTENATENEERLFWALRQLTDAEKALVSLYLEDYNYHEMADITGISENNVGVKLNRIKTKLKTILK